MRVVFDTNVLLSATLWDNSVSQKLLFKLIFEGVEIYSSQEILAEYKKVLKRDFEYTEDEADHKVEVLLKIIPPNSKVDIVKEDPDDNKIKTASSVFDEAIEDMSVVAESLVLAATKDLFTIEAESSLNHAKVEIANEKETSIETQAKDPVKSKYSIEYLKKIIKGSKLSPDVLIEFSKDYPLKIQYDVKDKLQLGFVLAPRVSTED